MKNLLVSVIIPTKNSEKTLGKCLESVKNQSYKNIEIIVVDNNSTDKTLETARKYADKFFQKGPERSSQRNYGAKMAKGKYYLFIDSDMELTKKVVEECITVSNEKDIWGVIIPEISIGEGFWAECKALEKRCYIGDETIEAARFFKKETFSKIGCYDENMIASEDWDLHQRVKNKGYKITRINSFIEHNEGSLSLLNSIRKKYYYGKTISKYIAKHPKNAKKQFTLFRPAFIKNWKILLKDPIHTIGLFIMKISEFGAGGLGYLKSRLMK